MRGPSCCIHGDDFMLVATTKAWLSQSSFRFTRLSDCSALPSLASFLRLGMSFSFNLLLSCALWLLLYFHWRALLSKFSNVVLMSSAFVGNSPTQSKISAKNMGIWCLLDFGLALICLQAKSYISPVSFLLFSWSHQARFCSSSILNIQPGKSALQASFSEECALYVREQEVAREVI